MHAENFLHKILGKEASGEKCQDSTKDISASIPVERNGM